MDLETSPGPGAAEQGPSGAAGFHCEAARAPRAPAGARSEIRPPAKPEGARTRAEPALPAVEAGSPPLAATVAGNREEFIRSLCRSLGADISAAARRAFRRAGDGRRDEAGEFENLVEVVVESEEPQRAAAVCAALAARTVARALVRSKQALGPGDAEALLSAWLEVARAIFAARGAAGLFRLLPTADLVARKSAERESAREMAASMTRVAARIAADRSLERAFGASH